MSRIINMEGAGKERTRLSRSAVLALRELMRQSQADSLTRDLAAYLALVLDEITETIDPTVAAWEKRGYWLKADRFRLEWEWCKRSSERLSRAVIQEDWVEVAQEAAQVAMRLNSIKLPVRHRLGTPWVGAWDRLKSRQTGNPA